MALNYITSISTGQSVFVESTTAGAPTTVAARGSIAIINVAGSVAVYINTSAGTTGATWSLISGGVGPPGPAGPAGPAGVGVTIIPAGGTISGTYQTSVYCLGNVTITGATTVDADLFVLGDLIETAAFALTVYGDLIVQGNVDFTAVATAQASVTVGGDFTCGGWVRIPQQGGASSSIFVSGDMTVDGSDIRMSPTDESTNGGNIDVKGDFRALEIRLSGTAGSIGGNGGNLTVGGNAVFEDFHGRGGTKTTAGLTAGNGSAVNIRGSVSAVTFYMGGGFNSTGSAGNGGSFAVSSGAVAEIYIQGGDCASTNPAHVAGSGGTLTVQTSGTAARAYFSTDVLYGYGGARSGALAGSAVNAAANGAYCIVNGVAVLREVDIRGGAVTVTGGTCQPGGVGGTFLGTASVSVYLNFLASGGDCSTLAGGNGGSIDVAGDFLAHGPVSVSGGESTSLAGGEAGSITVGGNATGGFEANGGNGAEGNGGNGGAITAAHADGTTFITSFASNGGNCTSSNSTHGAGSGGTILIRGHVTAGYIRTYGGSRTGTLTGAGAGRQNKGGDVTVSGGANVGDIQTQGGYINVLGGFAFNVASPPHGGDIDVIGILFSGTTLRFAGGATNAGNGGNGGTCTAWAGPVYAANILGEGGNTTFAGATAGKGGILNVANLTSQNVNLSDGTGAVAPASSGQLTVSGTCVINNLSIAANGLVKSAPSTCILRLRAMSPKTTLNLSDNTPTSNQAANLATNVYTFDGTVAPGQWLRIAGTAI